MMLLGRVIKLAMSAQSDFPQDVAAHNPALAAELAVAADQNGMDVPEFVAHTVSRFMAYEDGENWTTIVSNMQRSEDPGFAFISTIMRTRLDHHCQ